MKVTGRRIVVGAVLLVGSAGLGCAPEEGAPRPEQAPPAGATTQRLAPTVAVPRSPRELIEQPCAALSPEQAMALGFDEPPRQIELSFGTQDCTWRDSANTREGSVSVNRLVDQLEGAYVDRAQNQVFEPIQVGGLPGVLVQQVLGWTVCEAIFSLNGAQSLTVTFRDREDPPEDPCGEALRIAEVVISTLPPAG